MTESFEGFVRSRTAALLRLAYLLAGDRQLAEDLVQEVLVKAHRRWSRVGSADNADAYVRRMLVNEHLSRRRRRSSGELPTDEVADTSRVNDSQDAVAARDEMWRLLAALPARQRAVLVLRYYAELNDAQIAALLGCAVGTVRSLASRGLARLRHHPDLVRPPADEPTVEESR